VIGLDLRGTLRAGAWACAAAKLVARNCKLSGMSPGGEFAGEVRMWVYEEEVGGRKLTEIINETHENPKYLPGIQIGDNIVACPDLKVRRPSPCRESDRHICQLGV
jgi:glycerol-3-phosphate dehydrogenase (NAD+)